MTPPLFLLDVLPDGELLELTGDEGRHAARVRRLRVGEEVLIGDGRGALAHCRVTAVATDGLRLAVTRRWFVTAADPRLVVVQAPPKGERAELAVELMTELGVDEIVPWQAARALARWDAPRAAKALSRWRRAAREATKQSRRAWAPVVTELVDTAGVAARLAAADAAFVLHEAAEEPLAAATLPVRGEIVLVVGPEGGVAESELAAFAAARPVRLGRSVLRASTAGAAALAALSVRMARWD
ncbi:MAG: 16S rRNA (uracil(1498)-N(3))-methyltransferase [Actinomycetia bacterium]|nr:16S rRNA (uracil(1498)-N(3))-methyltransferase [Actinomycetes bacterium]